MRIVNVYRYICMFAGVVVWYKWFCGCISCRKGSGLCVVYDDDCEVSVLVVCVYA